MGNDNLSSSRRLSECDNSIKETNILPCLLKYESNGNFTTYSDCFKPVKLKKIIYRKIEDSDFKTYKNEVQAKMSQIIDAQAFLDITLYHCDSQLKFKKEKYEEYSKNASILVGKYVLYSLSLNVGDISFHNYWIKKIDEIAKSKDDDEIKAKQLDQIFKTTGYFMPLQVYLGGSFTFSLSDMNTDTKNKMLSNFISNINYTKEKEKEKNKKEKINVLNGKLNVNYESGDLLNKLFSYKSRNIIGGNIKAETFDDWVKSLNSNNCQVIEYKNIINIKNFLDKNMQKKLRIPLEIIEQKYEKKKEYHDIIAQLRDSLYGHNSTVLKGTETTSKGFYEEKPGLIYSKKYEVKGDGEFMSHITRKVNYTYPDIIVGFKIIDCWKDGTNGTWTLAEYPLLKNEIYLTFKSQLFRGEHFSVEVYLIKFPE